MKDWQGQGHVRWECKYHAVMLPKYRKKALYGRLRGKNWQGFSIIVLSKGYRIVQLLRVYNMDAYFFIYLPNEQTG